MIKQVSTDLDLSEISRSARQTSFTGSAYNFGSTAVQEMKNNSETYGMVIKKVDEPYMGSEERGST